MTDLAPLSDSDWPDEIRDLLPGFAGGLDVYRVMARHPRLLRAWQDLRQHIVIDTSLGPVRSEVVILRTGHRLGSAYEWGHHVCRARKLGMRDARIATIAGPTDDMSAEDAILANAVDQLVDGACLSSTTRAALIDLVEVEGMFDVMATVGFYSTLAFMANSVDLQLDAGIRAELAEEPAPDEVARQRT